MTDRTPHLDAHVHIVGNGLSGSGCWIRLDKTYHKYFLVPQMMRGMQITSTLHHPEFDSLYVLRLLEMVKASSLDRVAILAHDHVYDDLGRKQEFASSFYVPNDYVLQLAKQHPEFVPTVSIHPARPDALEELEKCLKKGAQMLKLLPNCLNVNCSDERHRPFWRAVADAKLPFLAHTGGELSVPVMNKDYENPQTLRLPLECGVKVIAAHCATDSHPFDANYIETLADLLNEYPNLYCDNSALNTPFRSRHFARLLKSPFIDRMIHGSDIPIPVSARWVRLRKLISRTEFKRIQTIDNSLERDVQIKLALGFPEASFTRLHGLLRHNETD